VFVTDEPFESGQIFAYNGVAYPSGASATYLQMINLAENTFQGLPI